MDSIETRLKHLRLRQPPEALRERVRTAARPSPSEWWRILRTLEVCTLAVLVVCGWCLWYEQGSEVLRRECRIVPPEVQEEWLTEQVAELTEGLETANLNPYLTAQMLDSYYRPFVVRPSS